MIKKIIPFNRPYMTGFELRNIAEAHACGRLAGDGSFTKRCHDWLEEKTNTTKALLTHSCTAGLEISALLLDIQPGDEVIMPSYTFVSTANAFVLRGGVPVFVDIREDTLNLNQDLIDSAITQKTRAIVPVHYAGVACEMDSIIELANKRDLMVIEDAAQGVMASYKGRPLGSIGDLGVYSFHETKSVISGEGGALLVNNPTFVSRAEVIREKGTDRSRFFCGEVDKYTWQDMGSSFLPGELVAAFLSAQLEEAENITNRRLKSWYFYDQLLKPLESSGQIRCPFVPDHCHHNAHMYYVVLSPDFNRDDVMRELKERGVGSVFHYSPLHLSPAGRHYGRTYGPLPVTESQSERLIRLPLWVGISEDQQEFIVEALTSSLNKRHKPL